MDPESRCPTLKFPYKFRIFSNFNCSNYKIKSHPNKKTKILPLANDHMCPDLKRFAKILISRFCRLEKLKIVARPPPNDTVWSSVLYLPWGVILWSIFALLVGSRVQVKNCQEFCEESEKMIIEKWVLLINPNNFWMANVPWSIIFTEIFAI